MGTQLPQRGTAPQFSAHVYCRQTAGWIKTPLGMVLCLGQGDIALDGDPAPPRKGAQQPPPLFVPCPVWPNGRPSQLLLSSCISVSYMGCLPLGPLQPWWKTPCSAVYPRGYEGIYATEIGLNKLMQNNVADLVNINTRL